MALVELINDADDAARGARPARKPSSRARSAKGVVRAKDTPTSSPTASASPACWPRSKGRELRPVLRRGRRPDGQKDGPRLQRHLPHRRRGRSGHDGHVIKTLQDNLQADRSSPASPPRRCWGADRQRARWARRAGPASTAGQQGDPAPGPGQRQYVPAGGKGRRDRRAASSRSRPPKPGSCCASRATRRPVPVGHPARRFHYAAVHLAEIADSAATSTSRCAGASA